MLSVKKLSTVAFMEGTSLHFWFALPSFKNASHAIYMKENVPLLGEY